MHIHKRELNQVGDRRWNPMPGWLHSRVKSIKFNSVFFVCMHEFHNMHVCLHFYFPKIKETQKCEAKIGANLHLHHVLRIDRCAQVDNPCSPPTLDNSPNLESS